MQWCQVLLKQFNARSILYISRKAHCVILGRAFPGVVLNNLLWLRLTSCELHTDVTESLNRRVVGHPTLGFCARNGVRCPSRPQTPPALRPIKAFRKTISGFRRLSVTRDFAVVGIFECEKGWGLLPSHVWAVLAALWWTCAILGQRF